MWQIIAFIPNAVHLFFRNFKKDERGLSGVVVAILLILIAVLAVVLIWTFLGEWLQNLWTQITGAADGIS